MGDFQPLAIARFVTQGDEVPVLVAAPDESGCLDGIRQGVRRPLALIVQDKGLCWQWLQGFFDLCGVSE